MRSSSTSLTVTRSLPPRERRARGRGEGWRDGGWEKRRVEFRGIVGGVTIAVHACVCAARVPRLFRRFLYHLQREMFVMDDPSLKREEAVLLHLINSTPSQPGGRVVVAGMSGAPAAQSSQAAARRV